MRERFRRITVGATGVLVLALTPVLGVPAALSKVRGAVAVSSPATVRGTAVSPAAAEIRRTTVFLPTGSTVQDTDATLPPAPGFTHPPPTPGLTPHLTALNLLHPLVLVLDAEGRPAALTGKPAASDRTCSACHVADFIEGHSSHWNDRTRVACMECHFEGALPTDRAAFDAEGRLRREFMRVAAPSDEECGRCHGLVHTGAEPLRIPDDFEARSATPQRSFALTLETGVVISAQDLSASFLNLAGKETLTHPWDVHARRRVGCIACHFAPNNPVHGTVKDSSLAVLVNDPRRLSFSEYLRQPDHRLAAAACRACHDPLAAHAFLPYRERHFETLACEACHVPRLQGPAARSIDATMVTAEGNSLIEYRGADRRGEESLNAAYFEGYAPLLLPARQVDGVTRLTPFNAVERWAWADGSDGPEVAPEIVRAALLSAPGIPGREVDRAAKADADFDADGEGRLSRSGREDSYVEGMLAVFDADGDGRLSRLELRLDSAAKGALIRARLAARGVRDPRLRNEVTLFPVRHGIVAGEAVQRDCSACHARNSRLSTSLVLGDFTPAGADRGTQLRVLLAFGGKAVDAAAAGTAVQVELEGKTRVVRAGPRALDGLYVFGHSGTGWPDRLGFLIFVAAALGTATHGGVRFVTRRRRRPRGTSARTVYLYSAYERIWHWLMAVNILLLMATGLSIHLGCSRGPWPLPAAVAVHNAVAVVLITNAFLSLFYHVTTSAIRQFFPSRQNLAGGILAQARFYARGIFLGQPHPSPKALDRKLNPLQQITYLALLNILFPLQAMTGALIWTASRRPDLVNALGGLSFMAPLHDLGAWFFLAFFVLHLYLTTTGHTVLSNVKAMIDGWDELDPIPPARTGVLHV